MALIDVCPFPLPIYQSPHVSANSRYLHDLRPETSANLISFTNSYSNRNFSAISLI